MNQNRQTFYNIITVLIVLLINIILNFGLSSYIVEKIGEEAYGFISLANTFISYASIISVALNSMASRFITIEIQKKNIKGANEYFTSVLWANIILIILLLIPSIIMIIFLENLINIPPELVFDVKLLFLLIFINFYISLIGGLYSIATYCTNKLYLTSIKNMQSAIIKLVIVVLLFMLLTPMTYYIAVATIISTIFVVIYNIKYTKELLPDIQLNKKYFSKEKIKILLVSGVWNSITNLGNLLTDGLDLILINLYISPESMGLVAIAKTPSMVLSNIISGIANVFQPKMIKNYGEKNYSELIVKDSINAMKINGIFGNIPFAFIIIFGYEFFRVWMPSLDGLVLYILGILTFLNVLSGGIISPLYNIYTINNEVKKNAILRISVGIITTIIVITLITITDWDVYVIVGTSAIIGLIVNTIIVPIQVSNMIKVKKTTFYPVILRYIIATVIMVVIYALLNIFLIDVTDIVNLIAVIIVCGIIGVVVNSLILLNKEEIKFMYNGIIKKVSKNGR